MGQGRADDRIAYLSEPEAIEPEFRRQSRLGLFHRKCGRCLSSGIRKRGRFEACYI